MVKSVLEGFRKLDSQIKETLADIESPLKTALSVLKLAKDNFGYDYLTVEAIIACLEAADISFKQIKITRALAGARNKINKKIIDGEIKYKITIHGRRFIDDIFENKNLSIIYVEAGTPRTARKQLDVFFKELKGNVRICDPYYGVRSFDTLELIPKSCNVLFLTAITSEKNTKIAGIINDFKKERPKTEIRKVISSKSIHDRYIISNDSLMIIGHGIKDIGNKDSFIFKIDKSICPELWNQIKDSFDNKWKTSAPLS